jgi:3',5'-cyclic AMP phosphodiesterase CpdA
VSAAWLRSRRNRSLPLSNPPFVLAHLSDPHVPSRLAASARTLMNKRIFGYLSWHLRRRRVHRAHVLEALGQDLASEHPGHVVITGDIVNISLPSEFKAARRWLEGLGPPERVTVVPGNHDAYVAVPWQRSLAHWGPYMTGDGDAGTPSPDRFPFVRRRGPVAIIGLSTAEPTAPGLASGRLGAEQLERLAECLQRLGGEGCFRAVLIHHPPQPTPSPRRKQLADGPALRALIAGYGAELILHGHDHRFRAAELAGPSGAVPVFGVPSASALAGNGRPASQYHLFEISRQPGGWAVTLRCRRFDKLAGRFFEADGRQLELPRPGWLAAAALT